ncbi:MAG: hypothetical protein A2293_03610 [Elusimicrobia bacterium RIFOXYB2_FULL_49_7]|nr:MAG: hypothetical protein A2293_03610 [Elusimicrobia bacterium RIFOXYB2_FULL_49_7]
MAALRHLFLLSILVFPLSGWPDEPSLLPQHILSEIRSQASSRFPYDTLRVVPIPSHHSTRFQGDTLFYPESLYGYDATLEYRFTFYAGLQIFQRLLADEMKKAGPRTSISPDQFYQTAIVACSLTLAGIHRTEKDPILDDLLLVEYGLKPFRSQTTDIIVSRDYQSDSLRYWCILKCILGNRCDSTLKNEWLNGSNQPAYDIQEVKQLPLLGKKGVEVQTTIRNQGSLACPFNLEMHFTGGREDTVLRLPGFIKDTTLHLSIESRLLSVEVDPRHRLFEKKEGQHKFVSKEYAKRKKVRLVFVSLLWDLFSLLSALALLQLAGIFIHPLTRLFYLRPRFWYALLVLFFITVKAYLPFVFFGFTVWGFVYDALFILSNAQQSLLMFCISVTALMTFWVFEKDGVAMNQLASTMKYVLTLGFITPLWIFILI